MTVLDASSGSAAGIIVENLAPARNQSPPALDTPILRNLISGFHWAPAGASGARVSASTRATASVFVIQILPGGRTIGASARRLSAVPLRLSRHAYRRRSA